MLLLTLLPSLTLRRLGPDDAQTVLQLLWRNTAHLTAHGDYSEQVAASVESIAVELATQPDRHWRFGICQDGELIGRVDLLGVEPPRYGLGYWLSASHTGRGLATEAVRTVLDFARKELGANDIFAGVTHGNARSVALLTRLGFKPIEQFATHTRYHRTIR